MVIGKPAVSETTAKSFNGANQSKSSCYSVSLVVRKLVIQGQHLAELARSGL